MAIDDVVFRGKGCPMKPKQQAAASLPDAKTLMTMAPIISAIGLALFGMSPGCDTTKLPEIVQSIRPGGQNSAQSPQPNTGQPPYIWPTSRPNSNPAPPQDAQFPQQIPQQSIPINPQAPPSSGFNTYQMAFWNMENFFDDHDDGRKTKGDEEYDSWLSRNPQMLQLKLQKLTEGLLSLNGGKGPDIVACAEIESPRSAQLLQQTLNAKLDPSLHYTNVVMIEIKNAGRHIAPAILTRLPVDGRRTKLLGSRQRILKTHVVVGQRELTIIVGHWTSRLMGGADKRMEYAKTIYGECNSIYHANPKADIIVCGDFNDDPIDPSVIDGLHSTNNFQAALAGNNGHLVLYNIFGNWTHNSGFGTLYYKGWNLFDQFHVSPGMLDREGWNCDPASVRIGNHLAKPNDPARHPWRFGGEKDTGPRGYSDHFPVTIQLRAAP